MTPGVVRELLIAAVLAAVAIAAFVVYGRLRRATEASLARQRAAAERALGTYTPQTRDRFWDEHRRHHGGGWG